MSILAPIDPFEARAADHRYPSTRTPPPQPPAIGVLECIAIEGSDARRFAQSQFAGDLRGLADQHWQWNAWLTAAGRVQALMHLVDAGTGDLLAVLRGGDAQAICSALERYVLRSRVALKLRKFTARAGAPQAMGTVRVDGEQIALGYGSRSLWCDPTVVTPSDATAQTGWQLADIRAGWPTLPAGDPPKLLPQALALERLGALSFDKGCYPGQEIAARLHVRGGGKRRLCHLHGPAPLRPTEIRSADGHLPATLLATVSTPDSWDALVILDDDISTEINAMARTYHVIQRFEP